LNGILIVDKPAGWTSHDVVGKLRHVFGEKRVGHGGTLDPIATGVLPVFIGRATRAVVFCENAEKEYLALFRTGLVTDTQDITGRTLSESGRKVSEEDILAVLPSFTGTIRQIPPMYSAVKKDGKKLYELARRGIETEREPRTVTVASLTLESWDGRDALLRVVCSKGTYIRTLCHDIGAALGCGGCMASLRRTRAGRFSLEDSVPMEDILAAAEQGTAGDLLRPVDSLFDCPEIVVTGENRKRCLNGREFPAGDLADGLYRVYDASGAFLLLGRCTDGTVTTVRSFFEVGDGT